MLSFGNRFCEVLSDKKIVERIYYSMLPSSDLDIEDMKKIKENKKFYFRILTNMVLKCPRTFETLCILNIVIFLIF